MAYVKINENKVNATVGGYFISLERWEVNEGSKVTVKDKDGEDIEIDASPAYVDSVKVPDLKPETLQAVVDANIKRLKDVVEKKPTITKDFKTDI